ncbi:MAG: Nudix hydrolase protein [Candidatus Dadabacteria bacterium]|nr:Nudix hydrolase protein [Candidatus Dadabacteria bacterium]
MYSNEIEELERIINGRKSVRIKRDYSFISAAVMVILREEQNGYSMLFIERPKSQGDPFSGHMAFPGGKIKVEDKSKLETGVRETIEETGIDLNRIGRILGELDDVSPINPKANHYVVTPYIAYLTEGAEIKPNEEVASAMWIPLFHFRNEKSFERRVVEKHGMKLEEFVYHYQNHVIWGMTARILHQFLSLAGHLFWIRDRFN